MASASRALGLPKFSPRVDGVSIGPGEFALALNGGLYFHPANHTKYKMDIFKNFTSDAALEVEGRWVHISRDAEVLVARSGNDRFAKKMKELVQKNNLDLSDESEENVKLLEELIIEAMSEAILLDWKGMTRGGEPFPYSKAHAVEVLRLKDFRKKINEIADNAAAYRAKEEKAQGNA